MDKHSERLLSRWFCNPQVGIGQFRPDQQLR